MLNVTVVESKKHPLEPQLRASGFQVATLDAAHLHQLAQVSAVQPDIVIVDMRGRSEIPSAVSLIRRQHPATGILIIAPTLDSAFLLEAMRAGANEVVSEPVTPADLERAIDRIVDMRPLSSRGEIFGFLGAKGGVGTTTIAVNIATALGPIGKPGRTLICDMHQTGGDAAVFFGAEPRFSIADALDNTHRLDQMFFRSLVTKVAPDVDLLAASDRINLGAVQPDRIRTVIDLAGSIYRYVVLDIPRTDAVMVDALDRLNVIVVVANQELPTVRSASRIVSALQQRYGRERVFVVISRSDRDADISNEDVQRAIGVGVSASFPGDYRVAMHALNSGAPVVSGDADNDLAVSFQRFAHQLAHSEPSQPAHRVGLFGRLMGEG